MLFLSELLAAEIFNLAGAGGGKQPKDVDGDERTPGRLPLQEEVRPKLIMRLRPKAKLRRMVHRPRAPEVRRRVHRPRAPQVRRSSPYKGGIGAGRSSKQKVASEWEFQCSPEFEVAPRTPDRSHEKSWPK